MTTPTLGNMISRPIANFHPCLWGEHFLNITHFDEADKEQENRKLKQEVGQLLAGAKEGDEQFKFIDTLERLGVAYHFEKEIEEALANVHGSFHVDCEKSDLYHVSLRFRIFRQHGFPVPSNVFEKFKDENGRFKDSLANDLEGLLSLYEASHVRVHDDKILDEALSFTTTQMNMITASQSSFSGSPLAEKVVHALNQPLHKGMPRVESRFYISVYEKDPSHNKLVLHFAKLDFNFVQSLHQKELKDLTRWWKGLHMKASFSRDRMTEAYFWIIGVYFEPQFALARKLVGKIFKSTTLTDDTYDAYATHEELEVLTEAFLRPWDKSNVDKLPEHVKWCYYTYVETCDEAEEELAKEGRAFCVDYLRQQVRALCKEFIQEAKWCNQKYIPTYEEYMKNALITSPYQLGTVASFLGLGEIASKEYFDWASQNPMPNVVKAASIIMRLMNDMGGHKFEQSRNHVASAVECLMEHNKVSEDEANEMLTKQVEDAWKDINQAMLRPYVIPKLLLTRILNMARSANVIYHGKNDGLTHVDQVLKDKVDSVLARSVSI